MPSSGYPVKPGLILCLDRAFPFQLNEIIAEKAIAYLGRGVVGVDIAGPESADFKPRAYRRLFDRCRRAGLGITVHAGEAGPVEEIADVIENLEPNRIGHGIKAAYDPRTLDMIRERGVVLEVCPSSNLNTRVVAGWDEFRWIFDTFRRHGVRYTINTYGPGHQGVFQGVHRGIDPRVDDPLRLLVKFQQIARRGHAVAVFGQLQIQRRQ